MNKIKEQKFDIKAQIIRNTKIFKENLKLITENASKITSRVDMEQRVEGGRFYEVKQAK